jgi:small subunit ribosomal protein S14
MHQPLYHTPYTTQYKMGGKAQLLRDIRKRVSADQFEVQRRAFLYVARNTALPNTVRHKAQLGLNALNDGEGRMHAVKNRCVETGRGRGELLSLFVQGI